MLSLLLSLSSSPSSVGAGGGSDPVELATRQLGFENTPLGIGLLATCFIVTLLATLTPFAAMRSEQFTHLTVITFSIWHAFIAGVLLASAWTLFLPNMIFVASHLEWRPGVPFVLLFCALLLPLLLDRMMLWMVGSKRHTASGSEGMEELPSGAITPTSSTPRFTPRDTPSRKTSVVGGIEEKHQQQVGGGRLMTFTGKALPPRPYRGDAENQPLTGGGSDIESGSGSMTPMGTPLGPGTWYGSARLSVDAMEFKDKQAYIARCAFCKENISTSKGLAYHAAGCPLKSFHAFSFSSRWMQGLRGRRSAQREIMMHEESAASTTAPRATVGWSLLAYVLVLGSYNVALAGGVNLQRAATLAAEREEESESWLATIVRDALVGLVMLCFTWFYGFSLGMMIRLHRLTLLNWRTWLAVLAYAVSLPAAILINYAIAAHLPTHATSTHTYETYLLVCQCACVGVLIYCSFVDMILEEWARRDAILRKTCAFGVGAAIVCAVAIWAPI